MRLRYTDWRIGRMIQRKPPVSGVGSLRTAMGSDPCVPTKVGTYRSTVVPAYSSVPCRIIAAMLK